MICSAPPLTCIVAGSSTWAALPLSVQTAHISTAPSTASPAELREARKVMARVEKQLARLGEREGRLHEQMLEHATDHARVLGLNAELRAIVDERDALEVEWLEAADLVD